MILVGSRNTRNPLEIQKKKQLLTALFSRILFVVSCQAIRKIKKIQKRFLKIILNKSIYGTLLCHSNKATMEIKRLRTLAVEIFKSLKAINPPYRKNIFTPKQNLKVYENQ